MESKWRTPKLGQTETLSVILVNARSVDDVVRTGVLVLSVENLRHKNSSGRCLMLLGSANLKLLEEIETHAKIFGHYVFSYSEPLC